MNAIRFTHERCKRPPWALALLCCSLALSGIAYGNSQFVAVGDAGTILSSPDGGSWTKIRAGTTNNLSGITFGNDRFVTVGYDGTILISVGGATWTSLRIAATLLGITF